MNVIDVLVNMMNESDTLPTLKKGYLASDESFVIYPITGSRITQKYYNGEHDSILNFEIAMKSKSSQKIHDTLWNVQTGFETIGQAFNDGSIDNQFDSFQINGITVTNKPYINQVNEQGWFVFLLDIAVEVYSEGGSIIEQTIL